MTRRTRLLKYILSCLVVFALVGVWLSGRVPVKAMQSAPVPTASQTSRPVPHQPSGALTATGRVSHPGMVQDADMIRVGISDDAMETYEYERATLSATVAYRVINDGQVVFSGAAQQPFTVTVSSQGFALSTVPNQRFGGPLIIEPQQASGRVTIPSITRRKIVPEYKGIVEITRGYSSPARLSVVNVLPLQEYLKAVVPNELPPRYGFEAVKAQSVAARNYAIRPRERTFPQFDICDSQLCQVYFGAQTEHPASNQALQETYGLVALHEGRPILALYSSAHGGHSEDYENSFSDPESKAFPGTPVPYLRGKPDVAAAASRFGDLRVEENARRFWTDGTVADFDGKSSYHRWEFTWPIDDLNQTLNQQWVKLSQQKATAAFLNPPISQMPADNLPLGKLQRIVVLQRGVSGKAMVVRLETDKGQFTARKEYVLRKLFAHNDKMLPSANMVFSHLTDPAGKLVAVKANGGGFGHGVGMSQLGASTLADRAYNFDQILQHYYSGVAIGTIPLTVGHWENSGGEHHLPQRVTFSLPRQGKFTPRLWLQLPQGAQPPQIDINGRSLNLSAIVPAAATSVDMPNPAPNWFTGLTRLLTTGQTEPALNLVSIPLPSGAVSSGQSNQLVLYPHPQHPQTPYRTWIEVIPPRQWPLK